MSDPEAILHFWFDEAGAKRWFKTDPAFDDLIRARFAEVWRRAVAGELAEWERTARSTLALVIVLDQFSRNMHRGSADAFSGDAEARAAAKRALEAGYDRELTPRERHFLYMPLMHSESLDDQERSVRCFDALRRDAPEQEKLLGYAERHRDIVARFGRFPHRNRILGRASTPEEEAFLKEPGSSFG